MNRTTLLQKLTSWPGATALCLLIVVGTLCVKLWPRTVPFEQCSEIYQKYAHTPGIDAAFVKDYRINDTVTIDATLLKAKDTNAWNNICKDFDIVLPPTLPKESRELMMDKNTFSQRVIRDTVITEHDSIYRKNLVIYSYYNMTMCIFQNINDLQHYAIIDKNIEEITH